MNRSPCEIRICFLYDVTRQLINSAFKMYTDPGASKDIQIVRQISFHRMLVVTLTTETERIQDSEEEQLPLRKSSKKRFATMSMYISLVFGTCDF
jgi:hypothetical protein